MRLLVSILLNGLAVYIVARILSGVYVDGYVTAIIAGLILGLINYTIRPVITFLTLPVTILTLGLFLLIINGAMVMVVDWLVPGFSVADMAWAIIFSLLLAVLNFFLGGLDIK